MKKNLALLFGGKSVEHEISIRSAKIVASQIDQNKYDIIYIGITKTGKWFYCDEVNDQIDAGHEISLALSQSTPTISGEFGDITIDIAFPLLHGTDGEDGSVQGFFKMLDIPLVGSDVTGSAIAMDKILSKQLWEAAGIPVAPFISYNSHEIEKVTYKEVSDSLGTSFMLKAGNLGSSVGVFKVTDDESFQYALSECQKYSADILVESFIEGRELECAILGNKIVKSTWPGEIILDKSYEFYTYEAKYEDEKAITIDLPAKVSDEISNKIRTICENAYRISRCKDYARVDLFLTESNEIIINEINTIPGFTDVSMFPMLWEKMDLSYPDLIQTIIDLAIERWQETQKLNTSFKN
jgi:D-alanine-D-alanine ligase